MLLVGKFGKGMELVAEFRQRVLARRYIGNQLHPSHAYRNLERPIIDAFPA
jgi:hypothetical protein